MREIAHFYWTDLGCCETFDWLLQQIGQSYTHSECFYYAFYFAAWEKRDVPRYQRFFAKYDDEIRDRIAEGGSLQSILKDIITIVGYIKFRRYFDAMGINRVHLFLEYKQVKQPSDLG